jgi:type II secretory pathway component GspD/PulD (secretin)
MPKDPTENIDRYKVRGGHLNEYEFQRNQESLAEVRPGDGGNLIPGTPPEQRSEQLKELIQKTTPPAKKTTKTSAKKSAKKVTSKKSGAKKATAKKSGSVKTKKAKRTTSAKKSGAKKKKTRK